MGRQMLLLVSEQPMANLLAALDPALGVTEVDLIVSGDMRVRLADEALAEVLEGLGLRCRCHEVSEPFQPEQTRSLVAALLANDPDRWIINLTGGTKPMMLGAYRAAVDAGVRDLLYMDHQQGLLRWLEGNRAPFAATAQLRAHDVLSAHGYVCEQARKASSSRSRLAQMLFEAAPPVRHELHRLMTAVEKQSAKGRNWVPEPVPVGGSEGLEALLHELCRRRLLDFDGRTIKVHDRDDHQFLAGSWFEDVVADTLEALQGPALRDLQRGLQVKSQSGARNEIDVAAMLGRQLLLVECKAGARPDEDKLANAGYKLEHLQRLGGLGTKLLFVSLDSLQQDRGRYRLESAGIGIVDGVGPDTLAEKLEAALVL